MLYRGKGVNRCVSDTAPPLEATTGCNDPHYSAPKRWVPALLNCHLYKKNDCLYLNIYNSVELGDLAGAKGYIVSVTRLPISYYTLRSRVGDI